MNRLSVCLSVLMAVVLITCPVVAFASHSAHEGMSYEDKAVIINQAADELQASNPELASKLSAMAEHFSSHGAKKGHGGKEHGGEAAPAAKEHGGS